MVVSDLVILPLRSVSQKCYKDDLLGEDVLTGMVTILGFQVTLRFPGSRTWTGSIKP